jgi:hypothetical protein
LYAGIKIETSGYIGMESATPARSGKVHPFSHQNLRALHVSPLRKMDSAILFKRLASACAAG